VGFTRKKSAFRNRVSGAEGLSSDGQYICIDSMPKQVQLSDDAYATLASLKRPAESFSEAVRRLAATGKDLRALRRLGPRLARWDDDAVHRRGAEADRKRLERVLRKRPRRGRGP
jgi:predicted CopG family antitoxin